MSKMDLGVQKNEKFISTLHKKLRDRMTRNKDCGVMNCVARKSGRGLFEQFGLDRVIDAGLGDELRTRQ